MQPVSLEPLNQAVVLRGRADQAVIAGMPSVHLGCLRRGDRGREGGAVYVGRWCERRHRTPRGDVMNPQAG